MKSLRTFFAISLPKTTLEAVKKIQLSLKHQLPLEAVRWTGVPNLHLTLQFLREINLIDLAQLIDKVHQELKLFPAFQLQLGKPVFFPTVNRPLVIALEAGPDELLASLATAIGSQIAALNYPIAHGQFRGHLTLGRLKYLKRRSYSLACIKLPPIPKTTIREVCLFDSKAGPKHQIYTLLERFSLAG